MNAWWLERAVEHVAKELRLEKLEAGQNGIEYFWAFWHKWIPGSYVVVKTGQWTKAWMRQNNIWQVVDLPDWDDSVVSLFEDEAFPRGKVFEWDFLDSFSVIAGTAKGTRVIEMDGEAEDELKVLENVCCVAVKQIQHMVSGEADK